LFILIPLAFLLNRYLVQGILHLDTLFETALFTLLVLPPPFIIPLYTSPELADKEKEYINNTLTMHTLISIIVFSLYFVINS
jgi:hypothetical protein